MEDFRKGFSILRDPLYELLLLLYLPAKASRENCGKNRFFQKKFLRKSPGSRTEPKPQTGKMSLEFRS
jgi:hypothetical protein